MKQILRSSVNLLAIVSVFFGLTTVADAAGMRGSKKRVPPPKIPYTAIISVDQSAMTITVGPKNSTATGTKTYKFTAKTRITANGQPGTVASLAPGQQVHIGAGIDPTIADELTVTAPPADPQYSGHDKQN